MEGRTEDNLARQFNERLNGSHPWGSHKYVKVLVVYWHDTLNTSGFRDEAKEVIRLFTKVFRYDVEEFVIPLVCSARRLRQCILSTLNELEELIENGKGPCLLILHYGGHGDRNDDRHQGQDRQAVWAASSALDSPLVEWYDIQSEFNNATADIVLFLDCCFAAQAAREREKVPGRIEMLAAAAMGVKTRSPGPRSFTNALLRSIRNGVEKHGRVKISSVATDLSRKAYNLETPVHITLRRGATDGSICLVPLSNDRTSTAVDVASGSSLRLLIKASTKLDLDDMVCWLRSDLPPGIASIQAEEIMRTTSTIHSMIQDVSADDQVSLRMLQPANIANVLATWSDTSSLLNTCLPEQRSNESTDLSSTLSEEAQSLLISLQTKNTKFINDLEQKLLENSQSDIDEVNHLKDLLDNDHLKTLGITDHLDMRRLILKDSNESKSEIEINEPLENNHGVSECHFRTEAKEYGQFLNPVDLPIVETRVHMLVELLNAPKSSEFRALKCARWYHQANENRFVLDYEVPSTYRNSDGAYASITLSEAIRQLSGRRRPSLGQRFSMADILGRAVRKWHTLGWVHQSISSPNVVFFAMQNGDFDYDAPFLQGFDFARPNLAPSIGTYIDNVEFNVYRHPSRQGPARKGHKKIHDLYSLGVVLLEIGLWEVASKTVGQGKSHTLTVDSVTSRLKQSAADRLGHYAGKDFQEATLTCLEGDFAIEMDDAAESRLAEAFQKRVLDKLKRCNILR